MLYKEEMAKVQEKHEKQLNELISENRRLTDKLIFYDERTKEFSTQIHALNEEKLMLLKQHEIMKSKLRTYEIGSTLNGGSNTTSASKFFDNMRGKLDATFCKIENNFQLNVCLIFRRKFPNGR